MNAILSMPSLELFPSYIDARREGLVVGAEKQKTKEEIEEIEKNPEKYIVSLNDQAPGIFTAPNGETFDRVPYEKRWLCKGKQLIGVISLRYKLNPFLEKVGGHIGYGIRPSMARKGYGTLALNLMMKRAGELGIEKLLVTCGPDNPASEKIIIKNGGIYQDTLENPYNWGPVKRFWVPVS